MPKYAKFMKDLLTNKAKFKETSKDTLNERCLVILLNKIHLKEKDSGSFTIPCAIGRMGIDRALADLGVSINLMPYSMLLRLELEGVNIGVGGTRDRLWEDVVVKIDSAPSSLSGFNMLETNDDMEELSYKKGTENLAADDLSRLENPEREELDEEAIREFMIISGADNRPSMLEKTLYDSWKSHMEHYIENWENGRMILNSVQNGPFIWPTVTKEDGTTRTKKYEELSATEKIQADCDCKATNIVLQGLPLDVYAIVNHHKVEKEI
nr:hypothetical protein [Tanacetum cinerariifolium]